MFSYLLQRLLMMFPLLIGITLISFIVIHLAPGEPTDLQTQFNPKASSLAKQRLREIYGLDKPLHVQYLMWLKRIVLLDFGRSFSPDNRKVLDKIKERIPITITINILSLFIIFCISIPIGVLSARFQYSFFDKVITLFVFAGFAIPTFWLALLLMIFFGVNMGWLPISGLHSMNYQELSLLEKFFDMAKHLIMPLFVATFGDLASLSRYARSNMLEVIRQDYITTARSKGLSETKVIGKHALRNALLPVVTILGFSIPGLIGGSVIFETIFAIPGMGQLFYMSVMARDYPVIMGILVIGAVLTMIGNLVADISYAVADPRIRLG
ncbi:MAG: diguanylate cyclase [Candidatus Schekmanbacteria bacterium GWA2_38_9]|uniref:Diguanylate cyclase n=1 Tax=Candidatus Schekmanbacteria bacterium RIFCSPLOWO2_12_FULL_38_15 TaxID=1817883 RepID=A0A1F7SG33_9BACT|nr:MAG: diguanylate cyclase [Candidatus Schekmanbacteria bacterium GWA2_38_9]OGL49553.1 MAG: diguanylate cyclase [Candidatus Schekmanbacteria bacterium RIFCSPLOWO2_02_FULL_38_14]OGL52742.1 MAG: diguanylate cyclase [Candidatus Schekmanbacteria bacterium RIFCSPLOWO2_12_FULL_38_15]